MLGLPTPALTCAHGCVHLRDNFPARGFYNHNDSFPFVLSLSSFRSLRGIKGARAGPRGAVSLVPSTVMSSKAMFGNRYTLFWRIQRGEGGKEKTDKFLTVLGSVPHVRPTGLTLILVCWMQIMPLQPLLHPLPPQHLAPAPAPTPTPTRAQTLTMKLLLILLVWLFGGPRHGSPLAGGEGDGLFLVACHRSHPGGGGSGKWARTTPPPPANLFPPTLDGWLLLIRSALWMVAVNSRWSKNVQCTANSKQ